MLQTVQIDRLPETIEEFVARRDRVATTPEGGAAMMVVALLAYAQDRALGQQCLTVAVDRELLIEGGDGYQGWQLRRRDMQRIAQQIAQQPYLPRSYVKGATPENGYELSGGPVEIEFAPNPHSGDPASGTFKPFVRCSGASSPRPVTVKRNERGIWKAHEWSSLVVGIVGIEKKADEL